MAKLYYFDARGLGEIVRLSLAAAGIEFTEELLTTREQFVKLMNEGKLMFNQVPLLEIDGKNLVQSNSIARYLSKKAGLTGTNEDEAVLIDVYYEGGRDFLSAPLQMFFKAETDVLANMKEAMAKRFPVIEKILATNGTGFFVGKSLTLADISWIEPLLMYEEYLGTEIFTNYPAIKKFYDTLISQPRIAAFLKGPQRKRKNDARTIEDINRVLCLEHKLPD